MSRLSVSLFLSASMLLPLMLSPVHGQDAPRVLLFVRDGSRNLELMLTREVGVMKEMLEQAGFAVDVATVSGETIRTESAELTPALKLADVVVSDYAGVILPCMAPSADYGIPPQAVAVVEKAVAESKPVAAQRGSVAILAAAGALVDRKYAFASEVDVNETPAFKGGLYGGTGVVQDGKILTSGVCPLAAESLGLPDGTENLTRALIDTLSGKP